MNAGEFVDVRMKGFGARTAVADVLRLIDARVSALSAERIASVDAAGRVLAEPIVSAVNVPSFAKSAMDGYAVPVGASGLLRVIGVALPGRPFEGSVAVGHAVRIMTGAAIPAGADAVIPVEKAIEADGFVQLQVEAAAGKHIVRIGEDVTQGAELLQPGRVLRPQDIGLLVAIGFNHVEVVRQPRVGILVTGNELLPPGSTPTGSQIVDSNSPMLAALIARDGGVHTSTRYVPDEFEAVRDAIRNCDADVVLISGGSSVGQEDHAPRAVAELGELAVHGIAIKPAGPAGVGFLRDPDRVAFPLPGNPVSCLCAYDLFASRAIRILGGRNRELPYSRTQSRLVQDVHSADGRVDYVRVKLQSGMASTIAAGASSLSSLVEADGFLLVPPEREVLPAGERVEVFVY